MINARMSSKPLFKFAVVIPTPNDPINAQINHARRFALAAEIEFERGREAQMLAVQQNNPNFNAIAAWHFGRCSSKAHQAETIFLSAQKSQTRAKRREYCRLKASQMATLVGRAQKFNFKS